MLLCRIILANYLKIGENFKNELKAMEKEGSGNCISYHSFCLRYALSLVALVAVVVVVIVAIAVVVVTAMVLVVVTAVVTVMVMVVMMVVVATVIVVAACKRLLCC